VTNAIEHAEPPVTLHLHHEQTGNQVWVGISDGGPAATDGRWTASCAEDEHGRGLALVDALATEHGIHSHPDGTTHWAQLPTQETAA
ncbi:ATP-binding protein, partial [Streptomyces sp. NPDC055109]